jgi:hypothetical protein
MPWRLKANSRDLDVPPTPPPPPLPGSSPGCSPQYGNSCIRKSFDAADWEAAKTKDDSKPAHQVLVSGLPNELLSEMMFTAILQQSGMDAVVRSFKSCPGSKQPIGQVLVSLDTAYAADWCCYHFHHRQWGGSQVTAEIISTWDDTASRTAPGAWEWPEDYSAVPLLPEFSERAPSKGYRDEVDSPAKMTPTARRHARTEMTSIGSAKSWLEDATVELAKERRTNRKSGSMNSSEASTRDEESESGDEIFKSGSVGAYSPGQ